MYLLNLSKVALYITDISRSYAKINEIDLYRRDQPPLYDVVWQHHQVCIGINPFTPEP